MSDRDGLAPGAPCVVRDARHAVPTTRRRVYIVDDDSMVRRSLSFALTTAGFEARAFVSGRDFLDEIDMLASGCVLLDVRMPDLDGIAVLDALGDRIRRFAVITMTGHGDVELAVKAMKRGAADFLEKPFTDAALMEALDPLFVGLPSQIDAVTDRNDAIARVARLTPRERNVLQGMIAGLSNKAVAHRLDVSVRTVEMHRGRLMERLETKSLADAVRLAMLAALDPL